MEYQLLCQNLFLPKWQSRLPSVVGVEADTVRGIFAEFPYFCRDYQAKS